MRSWRALRRGYVGLALLWLNACLLFVAANLAALGYASLRGRPVSPLVPTGPDPARLKQLLPEIGDGAADFSREISREIIYEPFTQFREKPSAGRFVNVDPAGFRPGKGQGPWPPEPAYFNVFLFGGSTTFGYGVPDDYTIGSYLQDRLSSAGLPRPPRVYNFGRGAYFSAQERALFEKLALDGFVPDLVVFVDGLNDFFFIDGAPVLTPWLSQLVDRRGLPPAHPYRAAAAALPLARILPLPQSPETEQGYPAAPLAAPSAPPPFDDPRTLDAVIRRYLTGKRLAEGAAGALDVRTAFVWQPVPMYRCDACDQQPAGFGRHEYSRFGYPRMAALRATPAVGEDFIWCADIQEGVAGPLYVDQVHYTPRMSDLIAACITEGLHDRHLVER
jgi:lysophospholipase L1-like esterase